jgi:hypothetical protein
MELGWRAEQPKTTTHPGKSRGWCSRRGSSVFPQSKEKEDYRKEWKNGGKSLLSGTAQGASEAWKGPVVVGRCVGNAGGGTRKVCGWQGQKLLRRITACRWSGKSKIEKGVTGSRVVRASSAWPCRILRQRERVKLAAACHISISPPDPCCLVSRCWLAARPALAAKTRLAALTATSAPRRALSCCAKRRTVDAECLAAGAGHARVPMAQSEGSIRRSSTGCWSC